MRNRLGVKRLRQGWWLVSPTVSLAVNQRRRVDVQRLMRFLLLAPLLLFDTSGRPAGFTESWWREGDWVIASNDPLKSSTTKGDVVGLQITRRGESCMFRKCRLPLHLPSRVTYKIRWTEAPLGAAYPSVHLIFDPPAFDDQWWKKPIGNPTWGRWSKAQPTFLFHFATDGSWRQFGMTDAIESADNRHEYSPPQNQWIKLVLALSKEAIVVSADGKKVAECAADLSKFKTFTFGFGDQASTRVEVDEVRVTPGE